MPSPHAFRRCGLLALLVLLSILGAGCTGPAFPKVALPAGKASPQPAASGTVAATPGPVTLTLWHRWPPDQTASVRSLLDAFQESRPDVKIELVYQANITDALLAAKQAGQMPDIVVLPGDRIAEHVRAGLLAPLDVYVDATWVKDSFFPAAADALRYQGKLWGLPFDLQVLTFIYNQSLIAEEELPAQTSEIFIKGQAYEASHRGIRYLGYPAKDVYFAAPWFYGAGAWYAHEDGSVGIDTPGGRDTAGFLAALKELVPADVDYARADSMFKAGQLAITVNGPWYLTELEAAGIPYALQIMPLVTSSGQPARPLVTANGLMLGANPTHPEPAVRVIAYLAGSESELSMARRHRLVPSNRMAAERAGQEGYAVIAHFAQQAGVGEPMPATPNMSATWAPITQLLGALQAGTPPAEALRAAQAQSLANIKGVAGK